MLTRSGPSHRVPRGSGLMSRTESGGRILINGMWHPRAVKNLDDVIEEIELRLFSLKHLLRGDIKLASSFLEKMERILDALMRFDYPTALVALKRKQDIARSLIEKTRGEVAVAARSQELADKLDAVRGKL